MSGSGAGRAAALALAILLAAGSGCARQEAPSGGPADRTPPVVVAVTPEALSRTDALGAPIRIRFSERISERPSAGLMADVVTLSPEPAEGVEVRHRRDLLEVGVPGGLAPGLVYRVTVQPVIRDLFGNQMREPFEFAFSTGAELHPTAVVGLAVDRVTGRPVRDLRVVATTGADGPRHVARTDTGGVFTLRYLPPGRYDLVGFLDRNRNRLLDPSEPRGGVSLDLGAADTLFADFPVIEPDTTPARLSRVETVEPALLRLTFDDYLDPEAPLALLAAGLTRWNAEGPAPEVRQLLHEERFVELSRQAAEPPPEPGVPQAPRRAPVQFAGRAQNADTTALALLGLALPSRVLYAELSDSLAVGVEYLLRLEGVVNLTGVRAAADSARVPVRTPPPGGPGGPR